MLLFLKIRLEVAVEMDTLLPQFENIKDKLPEFVMKLYHILQLDQYSEYISWHGDNQLVIKNPKKFEEKVLPYFFRHRHMASFIRQLNMYKFNKVVKLVKERNHMYFRNQHFRRGQTQQLLKIKRNSKKSKAELVSQASAAEMEVKQEDNISIDQHMEQIEGNALSQYRHYVRTTVGEITASLKKLSHSHPELMQELNQPIHKCQQLLELKSEKQIESMLKLDDSNHNGSRQIISTIKLLNSEHALFPSSFQF